MELHNSQATPRINSSLRQLNGQRSTKPTTTNAPANCPETSPGVGSTTKPSRTAPVANSTVLCKMSNHNVGNSSLAPQLVQDVHLCNHHSPINCDCGNSTVLRNVKKDQLRSHAQTPTPSLRLLNGENASSCRRSRRPRSSPTPRILIMAAQTSKTNEHKEKRTRYSALETVGLGLVWEVWVVWVVRFDGFDRFDRLLDCSTGWLFD